MKHFILFLLFLSTAISSFGQVNVDSLISLLDHPHLSPNETMQYYEKICNGLLHSNPEKVTYYAKEGLVIAEKEKDLLMSSYYNEYIGISYSYKNQKDLAILFLEKALADAIEINNPMRQTRLYMNLGATIQSRSTENLDKALDYYMKALKPSEEAGNKGYQSVIFGNIGQIHLGLDNRSMAIEYLEKAKVLADEFGHPQPGILPYYTLASLYIENHDYDKAEQYAWKAIELCDKMNDKMFKKDALIILGRIYYDTENLNKAMECVEQALTIAEEFGVPIEINEVLVTLSEISMKEKRYKESEEFAFRAWQIDSTQIRATDTSFLLGMSNLQLGNKEKSSSFFWKHYHLTREVTDKKYEDSLTDMEVKYETEKKELQITALEKEKKLYTWLVISSIFLISTLGIILWLNIKNSRREKQLIATRAVWDGEMKERERLARDLHDRLGGNMSALKLSMNSSTDIFNSRIDECIEEIRRVSHNLMPLSLKDGIKPALTDLAAQFSHLDFLFFGEEKRFNEGVEFIVYCCCSELITNALRHSSAKNIVVQLIQHDKYISATVQDDGCGFDLKNLTHGTGLKSIKDRILSCNGTMDIITAPGKGTEIVIEIKA